MKRSPHDERRGSAFVVSLLGVLAVIAGCARNPVSARPEFTVISAAEERRIGAEQAAQLVRTIGLVDNPAGLGTDVQEVGRRLASKSPRQDVTYTFAVLDMVEPNAGLSVGVSAHDGVFDGETFRHPDLDFAVRMPAQWKAANSRQAVLAVAADHAAMILLALASAGAKVTSRWPDLFASAHG